MELLRCLRLTDKGPTFFVVVFLCLVQAVIKTDAAGSNATTVGQCVFFGDNHIECRGRLRCKPSDFRTASFSSGSNGEQQLPELEQVCPGVDEFSNGTWNINQGIVPQDYATIPYPSGVVAKCHFRTNGSFYCVGGPTYPDTFWEGKYSGSLNAAFDLGLDRWYFTNVHRRTTTPMPTTLGSTRLRATILSAVPSVIDERLEQERQEDRSRNQLPEAEEIYVDGDDRYPARQQETLVSDPSSDDLQGVSGTRDAVNRYDAQRAAAEQDADQEQSSVTFTVAPRRVFVCEYYNNGQVGCRNCTEKVHRIVLESGENGNRRDYNCSQPKSGPILKRWNADNGIIPMTPDPQVPSRSVVATCIFEKSAQTYECHGESGLCPDDQGNRVHTNKCLGGRRWSGDYTGDFGYLL